MNEQKSETLKKSFKKGKQKPLNEKNQLDLDKKEDKQDSNIIENNILEERKKTESKPAHFIKESVEIETPKGKLKLSIKKEDKTEKKGQLVKEMEPKKKDDFILLKKEQIDKINSKFTKKKLSEKEEKTENEKEEIGYKKKKFNKKKMNILTDEDMVQNMENVYKKTLLNTIDKKAKKYKKKFLNLSDEEEDEYANLNEDKNLNNLSFSTSKLATKIKIFKCVIWKNTDPDINEDILKTILHYRNRSQGLNKSFIIKLPKDLNFEKISNNQFSQVNTEENNIVSEKKDKNNPNKIFPIKNSKSYVNFYKKSYFNKK